MCMRRGEKSLVLLYARISDLLGINTNLLSSTTFSFLELMNDRKIGETRSVRVAT